MYRQRFYEILDNLRVEHDIVLQENTSLKQHIKELEEQKVYYHQEIKKTQIYINDLKNYIKNLRRVPYLDMKGLKDESSMSLLNGNVGTGSNSRVGGILHGNNIQGNNIQGNNIQGNNLHGNNLHGNNLHGSILHGNILQGNNLHGSILQGNNTPGNNTPGINCHGNNLHGNLGGMYGFNFMGDCDLRKGSHAVVKMGSDWTVEGEDIVDIKLVKKYNVRGYVGRAEVSNDMKLFCFAAGRSFYLLESETGRLFFLDTQTNCIEDINISCIKKTANEERGMLMCFSTDNRYVYTAGTEKIIRKWDLEDYKLVKKINVTDDVCLIKCRNNKIYVFCKDMTFRIFDEDKVKEILIPCKGQPTCLTVTDSYVFIGMIERKITVLNLGNDEVREIQTVKVIHTIDFTEDDKIMLGGLDDTSVFEINYSTMEVVLLNGPIKSNGKVLVNSFFGDNKYSVLCCADKSIRFVELESLKSEYLKYSGDQIISMSLFRNFICTISFDGNIRIWRFEINK